MYLSVYFCLSLMTKAIELTLKNVAPFQGAQKDGPLLKMAMFEEDI
jgi:hypothetical protein